MGFLESSHLLTMVVFFPAAAGVLLLTIPAARAGLIRVAALVISLVAFGLSLLLLLRFEPAAAGFQFSKPSFEWIRELGVGYRVGIDGISLLLVLLTTLLIPISILGSWKAVSARVREFHIALLFLETGLIGVFAAVDLALFYIFWEVMLIPMVLLIGIWGSGRRIYAAMKFFVYTMAGSLLMFLAILYLYLHLARSGYPTFDLQAIYGALREHPLPAAEQAFLFAAFAFSFAIKVPLFPLHTWLPDAHTEAPTAGSVVLAGVLLKMGAYGFIRFAIPFFPEAAASAVPWISWLAIVSIAYGALMCLVQEDFKRLIAYSSVSHLGFVMLGIFALNARGVVGGIFQMISHGISTGALFLLVGLIYDRTHTRRIADYGGLAALAPRYSAVFLFVTLASIGLPSLSGFVGEFLILQGTWEFRPLYAALGATGIVLGALYMLNLYQRVFFGKANSLENGVPGDLDLREIVYLAPLLLLMAAMGMGSPWFTDLIEPSVARWLRDFPIPGA